MLHALYALTQLVSPEAYWRRLEAGCRCTLDSSDWSPKNCLYCPLEFAESTVSQSNSSDPTGSQDASILAGRLKQQRGLES